MSALQRFKVTLTTARGKQLSYTVGTPFDARKAVALAAQAHQERVPDDPLDQFVRLEGLPGTATERDDIIDRDECY